MVHALEWRIRLLYTSGNFLGNHVQILFFTWSARIFSPYGTGLAEVRSAICSNGLYCMAVACESIHESSL